MTESDRPREVSAGGRTRWHPSLRQQLIALMVLFAVIAVAGALYQRAGTIHESEQRSRDALHFRAQLAARDVNNAITVSSRQIAAQAKLIDAAGSADGCTVSFNSAGPFHEGHTDIIGLDGRVFCSSRPEIGFVNYGSAPWLTATRKGTWAPYDDPATGRRTAVVFVPVKGIGVVATFLQLSEGLSRLAGRLSGSVNTALSVVAGGRTVAASEVLPDDDVISVGAPIGTLGWRLVGATPRSTAIAEAVSLSNRLLEYLGIAFLALLLAVQLVYTGMARPIRRLSEAVRGVVPGEVPAGLTRSGPAEVVSLGDAFNMLTRAVRDELSARRDAEAAHAAVAKERDAQAAMLHLVIQSSPALIYVKDLEGRYVMVNEAFERALGRTEAEVIGRTDAELDPALDALWAANDRLALEGLYHLEETFDGPRGRRIHEGVKFPLHDASGTLYAVCGVSLDVTEQRNAITVTAQARDAALAANAAKSAFLATMSHEIRTPMNAVIGMTDLLEQTELDPQQHEFVTTVRSSGEALLAIINDILDFSKIESGEMDLERAPFVLRDEVEGCLDLVARQASAKGLDLLADIADGCPTRVVGDATRLRQILTNLLANAVKFTEHGQVLVEVRCADGGRDRVRIVLSVTDTGIGISEEDRGRLFRSFSQIDASTTRVYGGTGLGLVISRRLAEAMNGSITVEDNPAGQGSRFTVEVTLGRCADTEGLHGRADLAAPVLAGRSVLLVDDNPTNLRILELQVTRLGMSCASATSGERALELVRGGLAYDVAILDMRMNDMDGVELGDSLKQLPGRSAAAPLILLTSIGYTRSDSEHSFAALLTKPVKSISLRDTLTVVLGGRSIAWSEHAEAADDGHAAARRVLLAEDNVVNQRVVQLMLTNLGHSVEVVADGVEAVRAVETNDYDVVLMDVQMPRMDGLEATRRIRTTVPSSRQPHIVALTASALVEDREACAAAGMEAYLTKPVRRRELQEMLDRTTSSGTVPAR